ncbi:DUF4832 domain-containing protein [Nitrospira japonica]|uniref:DUF4832 domain-containing protein n=1 Tax=Nitrospira japonica TaxID=1325564 RepID=UPI00155FEDDD|nr:DUF4832 domain-containing protein [Nitrospira japonica]
MKTSRSFPILLTIWYLLLSLATSIDVVTAGEPAAATDDQRASPPLVTVYPLQIDDILYNPGMGFADFHFGFDHPPSRTQYPRSTVAYFRWSWADLEPVEGEYNFQLVDDVIAQARAKGETLAFRIMTEYEDGSPAWLLDKGVASVSVSGGTFPDYNDPRFLEAHERLLKALGARYGDSPAIDHVDIGSIGCWGEWNMACCLGVEARCKQLYATEDNQRKITDWYFQYFPAVPLVALVGGQLAYATAQGAGWRGDCFGDYGYFRSDWNHMDHVYARKLRDPVVAEAWKHGPIEFEVCGVMQDWIDKGFNLDLILQKGLEWHVSVLNAKSEPVPESWRPRIEEFQKRLGYRLVLRELTHTVETIPGGIVTVRSQWNNVGVAPMYHDHPLAYRLRSNEGAVVAQWESEARPMDWLPGSSIQVEDAHPLSEDLPAGRYHLDVAVLSEDGSTADVELAIAGKRADRWYPVSALTVRREQARDGAPSP